MVFAVYYYVIRPRVCIAIWNPKQT